MIRYAWNKKKTEVRCPHCLQKFSVEFETGIPCEWDGWNEGGSFFDRNVIIKAICSCGWSPSRAIEVAIMLEENGTTRIERILGYPLNAKGKNILEAFINCQ